MLYQITHLTDAMCRLRIFASERSESPLTTHTLRYNDALSYVAMKIGDSERYEEGDLCRHSGVELRSSWRNSRISERKFLQELPIRFEFEGQKYITDRRWYDDVNGEYDEHGYIVLPNCVILETQEFLERMPPEPRNLRLAEHIKTGLPAYYAEPVQS